MKSAGFDEGGRQAEGHDVADAESFGNACADVWWNLKQKQMEKESSIGALMEHLEHDVLNQLQGANITLERA